jgi:hypothetical protein
MRHKRITHSGITRTLIALVISGCGVGSGLVGTSSEGGGTGGGPPSSLSFFRQPNSTTLGQVLSPIEIVAGDSLGAPDSAFTGSITLSLASNPTGATLGGTTTEATVNGIATFSNLSINRTGTYSLSASTGTLTVTSSAFTIDSTGP